MKEHKRHLKVAQGSDVVNDSIVQGLTCYNAQAQYNVNCGRKNCQHWINNVSSHNCVILAAQDGPHTLQKIGQIYDLTRMRICQIEKAIFEKIRKASI